MKLKPGINIASFIREVGKCRSEVLFCTDEGDILNLNSVLSRYIFATISDRKEVLYSAQITCKDEADKELIKKFLED